jgi:hypothetical protein
VDEAFERLRGKTFKWEKSRTTGLAPQLNNQLLFIVQQELLADEGLAQHLDQRPSVQMELEPWRQQILSKYAEMEFKQKVQVSDQDLVQYLKAKDPDMLFPKVQIRELHTKDPATMDAAIREIQAGTNFESVVKEKSSDLITKQRGGLSEMFGVNTRIPLGILALRMNIGARQGPIRLLEEFIYFELVKKEFPAGMTDSSFQTTLAKEANDALTLKQKRSLDVYIAKCAQERGYAIFDDRLKLLKVSKVPMMTFRILGFGGRMFAAPFTTPQADWIGVENPEKIPLP